MFEGRDLITSNYIIIQQLCVIATLNRQSCNKGKSCWRAGMGLSPGLWNENAANHHSYHRPQVRQTSSAGLQTPFYSFFWELAPNSSSSFSRGSSCSTNALAFATSALVFRRQTAAELSLVSSSTSAWALAMRRFVLLLKTFDIILNSVFVGFNY